METDGNAVVTRWHNEDSTWFADYSSLSFQESTCRVQETAENVYDALVKAKKQISFSSGSSRSPEIVILGCGPAPEMVAVKVFIFLLTFRRCPSAQ